jgi:hypothetical protein
MRVPVYLIIGCGRFGRRAVQVLARRDAAATFLVIDQHKETFRRVSRLGVETLHGDAVHCLDQVLSSGRRVDHIIPAVPFHLAFEFLLSKLKPLGAGRVEVPPLGGLPNAMRGKTGDLYVSFADFTCPEGCNEPPRCTVTGKPRKSPLFKVLAGPSGSFDLRVIRSRQLAPGVGGFRTLDLLGLLKDLERQEVSDRPFLISTACRCHGVISALSLKSRKKFK